jgi:bifunctional UDP-N-acetylglucosamine pyrophosphorylase/glucosamine-1-phosphate N-acetyltransferase
MTDIAIVVLAAGKGTRMKSALPKVMHKAAGRSLLGHVLAAARGLAPARVVVVHGPDMESVQKEARTYFPACDFALQAERNGTAGAVRTAEQALRGFKGTVLVLYADVPLIRGESLSALAEAVHTGQPIAVMGFEADDPTGYGRLLRSRDGHISEIREELDASPEERKVRLCNSGIIAMDASALWQTLPKIGNQNAKGEYYLTDLVGLVAQGGGKVGLVTCQETDVAGVNDRVQLAAIEARLQERYRKAAMLGGATLLDPATVYFSADTELGSDVVIEPYVFFGTGVRVGDNVEILAHCHLEGAAIANGARIGPYARLRPGADIGPDAHIGNFVEVKKARIGKGAKANHLTYIGDAVVGAGSNIGAGTITCNYDGYEKHLTEIGERVFVGSNTALVAPVKVGDGANIAAGSVISDNVPADALAITRAEPRVKEGWAARYRKMKQAKKAQKAKSQE